MYAVVLNNSALNAVVDKEGWEKVRKYKWHAQKDGNTYYAVRRHGKGQMRMHCLIMGGKFVDHINGNGLDNRSHNLRFATVSENRRNSKSTSPTGFKGVTKKRNKFQSQLTIQKKTYYLGIYQSPEEAAHAYDVAARGKFGEFARLNFPWIVK